MEQKLNELIQKISACIIACNNCHDACLEEENVKSMAMCIRLDKDCANICTVALNMLYKNAPFTRESLMLCRNACITCKLECKKFPMDHCQQCYQACKDCATACDDFVTSYYPEGCGCGDN